MAGKYAARATPICAFAAAGATLGRRDVGAALEQVGRQRTRDLGQERGHAVGGRERRPARTTAGARPVRIAIACSSAGALRVEIDSRGLRRLELRLGQRHIGAQRNAGAELRLRELQRLGVCGDGVRIELALRVDVAQLQVVLRKRRLDGEACGAEVTGARLGRGDARLDAAAHAAEQIGLPARAHADAERRRGDAAIGGRSRAAGGHVHAGTRPVAGVCCIDGGQCLAVLRLRLRDAQVRGIGGVDEGVERGVAVPRPPGLTAIDAARLGRLPLGVLLVSRGHVERGRHVVGARSASGEQQRDAANGDGTKRERHGNPARGGTRTL
jgi:hypothetical protein